MANLQKDFGWKLGPIQFPSGLHISVTHLHSRPGVSEKLLAVKDFSRITQPDGSFLGYRDGRERISRTRNRSL